MWMKFVVMPMKMLGTKISSLFWNKESIGNMDIPKPKGLNIMKNAVKMASLALVAATLIGCKSTPEQIEPRAHITNASEAFNIANQTSLMRNDSPLKDFTQEEVNNMQAEMKKYSGGDTSILFGTLSMLTGNFTGVIDIVGGSAANLANSKHTAAYSRWFVELPKGEANSAQEAWKLAASTIREAQKDIYSQFGEVRIAKNKNGNEYLVVSVDGEEVPFGASWNPTSKPDVVETESSYLINYSTRGYSKFIKPSSAIALYVQLEQKKIDPIAIYKEVSSKLPKGYYLYVPSFEKHYLEEGTYIDLHHPVPSIYSSGDKYDFIQP